MTDTQAGTQLALPGAGVIVNSDEFFRGSRLRLFSSFDVTTDDGKIAIMTYAQSGLAAPLADMLGKEFDIEHLLMHVVELEDEDEPGVMVQAVRTVLVDTEGNAYAATSAGIVKSLQFLMGLWGQPPYRPARRVKVVTANTRKKRKVFNIIPVVVAKVATDNGAQTAAKTKAK